MAGPLVSIIIPVYNSGKTALKLLAALEKSTYQELEIIVIDDGSTDDSLKLLRKEKGIKLITQDNAGPSAARNRGLEAATGDYICFIDSDDLVKPEFVETLLDEIQKPKTALAGVALHRRRAGQAADLYTRPLRARRPTESHRDYILWLLTQDGRLYPVANKIFRGSIIRKYHLRFNERLKFAEDTTFVLDYLSCASGEIRFNLAPLYCYNLGGKNSVVSESSLHWSNWQESYNLLEKWLGPDTTARERGLMQKIHQRWQISHALAVARAKLPYRQKTKLLNPLLLLPATIIAKFRP